MYMYMYIYIYIYIYLYIYRKYKNIYNITNNLSSYNNYWFYIYLFLYCKESEAGMEMSQLVTYIQPIRFHSFDFAES